MNIRSYGQMGPRARVFTSTIDGLEGYSSCSNLQPPGLWFRKKGGISGVEGILMKKSAVMELRF